MPRTARTIVAGHPHHVTQRGNRRMPVFFRDFYYPLYMRLLSEQAEKFSVEFWSYCLMPNHVHLIAVPRDTSGMASMFREAHRRYTRYINHREEWTGHLWQDRYASFVMDEPHALMAARYIENNPVHAGLVSKATEYRWSSAAYHAGLKYSDPLIVKNHTLKELIPDWQQFLAEDAANTNTAHRELFIKHEKSGKPLLKLGTE